MREAVSYYWSSLDWLAAKWHKLAYGLRFAVFFGLALGFHCYWFAEAQRMVNRMKPPNISGENGFEAAYIPAYADHSVAYGWATLVVGWLLIGLCLWYAKRQNLRAESNGMLVASLLATPIELFAGLFFSL
ncbi:hypothetical protein ACFST9_11745 [Hymenobacter monticola]|uniref:Uncharacterized protein n=1 Tax=Hymenobacter monticola TaxID=1705399 RepID=A0ABY4B7H8_9BACT|nr:hypothetical protein [Hymenobacter monticola]UOE35135.1 hypothetical protein MTP16_05665 [Hymenobacter monticola]